MYSSVITGAVTGIESTLCLVEVDVSKGMPAFEMVGQLGNEVREARERVKVALKNAMVEIPAIHLTSAFHRLIYAKRVLLMICQLQSEFL